MKKYKINDERYRELLYFVLQYNEWRDELSKISVIGSPDIDGMPRGSGTGDPTGRAAAKYGELLGKIQLVEKCARDSDQSIYKGLLKGVTTRNLSFNWLVSRGYLYCGRDKYFLARRKFFWLLDQRKE